MRCIYFPYIFCGNEVLANSLWKIIINRKYIWKILKNYKSVFPYKILKCGHKIQPSRLLMYWQKYVSLTTTKISVQFVCVQTIIFFNLHIEMFDGMCAVQCSNVHLLFLLKVQMQVYFLAFKSLVGNFFFFFEIVNTLNAMTNFLNIFIKFHKWYYVQRIILLLAIYSGVSHSNIGSLAIINNIIIAMD